MLNMNKATLIGHVGRDVDMRVSRKGVKVARFSLATSERWRKAEDGESGETWEDHTEWHRIVVFGRLAELAEARVRTGTPLYIEGRIRRRQYTDKEGLERSITEIHLAGPAAQLNILTAGDGAGAGEDA